MSTSLNIFTPTISGSRTKRLLRPGWLTCTLLPEGPSWLLLGPSWEPRCNFVLFNSMYFTHCEGCGAACQHIYNTVLRNFTACHKSMPRNFRTKDVYLDKTERLEHRNKLNLRVQKHNFIPPNTNFLVKEIIPPFIPTVINFCSLQITTIMLFLTKINILTRQTLSFFHLSLHCTNLNAFKFPRVNHIWNSSKGTSLHKATRYSQYVYYKLSYYYM